MAPEMQRRIGKSHTSNLKRDRVRQRESHSVCIFHELRELRVVVHGDDFTFEGTGPDLLWITEKMKSWFEIEVMALLGPDEGDYKHVVILGRHVQLMGLSMRLIQNIGS